MDDGFNSKLEVVILTDSISSYKPGTPFASKLRGRGWRSHFDDLKFGLMIRRFLAAEVDGLR